MLWRPWLRSLTAVKVILRPTVSQPIRPGVRHPSVTRDHFCQFFRQLRVCWCAAPSLTRERVCNLQFNDASSISSYVATDGQSATSSWCLAPLGTGDQMLHLFEWQLLSLFVNFFRQLRVCWCGAPSLTRGRVCNLQFNDASSISSYIATDGLLDISSWFRAPNGAHNQILISLFDSYFIFSV
jgi:hypothetical protein